MEPGFFLPSQIVAEMERCPPRLQSSKAIYLARDIVLSYVPQPSFSTVLVLRSTLICLVSEPFSQESHPTSFTLSRSSSVSTEMVPFSLFFHKPSGRLFSPSTRCAACTGLVTIFPAPPLIGNCRPDDGYGCLSSY